MKWLIQWALGSSVLLLVVLALRLLLKDKLSARWRYALWAVALARLLVPLQFPVSLPVSLASLTPELPYQLDYPTVSVYPPGVPNRLGEFVSASQTYLEGGNEVLYTRTRADGTLVTTKIPVLTRYQVLERGWGVSALLTGAALLAANGSFLLRLRKRRRPLEVLDCPLPVYEAEGLPSPCLCGVFRPAIYLTPEAVVLPEEQRRHILAHELTHYAHRDHLWSLLRCLALALHWYNPLVWLAAVLSKGDGELACDEGAVARLGEEERIPYGRTLVDMVAKRPARPADLLSCSTAMTGGRKSIRRRVARLVKHPKTVRAALFAAVAVMALSVVFVFAARQGRTRNDSLLDFLDRTTSIRYAPPLYSSTFYPHPISDEDLLAQAKEALSGFTALEGDDPSPDLREAIHESRITLILEDREIEYSLLWQNDRTYLFTGSILRDCIEFKEENGENFQLEGVSGTRVSEEGKNVIAILQDLARQ